MAAKIRIIGKNTATLMVSILFCLAIAETAVRVMYPEKPQPEDLPSAIRLTDYMTYDPNLGWKLKPHATGTLVTSEYQTHISINSKGVRGPEIPYAKADNERRVLILGDSFIEGDSQIYSNKKWIVSHGVV